MDTTDTVRAKKPAAPPAAKAPRSESRISDEPALVLHSYPYRETSLLIEAFTRNFGRIALVARGAKRPRSALRGVLLAFQPLTLSWVGGKSKASELRTLTRAEWIGGLAPLRGEGLLCGFYLNELLIKLLARDDAHATLFDHYLKAIANLGTALPKAPVLREFEFSLLREAGYALDLGHCTQSGEPVTVGKSYRYVPELGPVEIREPDGASGLILRGETLRAIEAGDYSDPQTQLQGKLLMRQLLNYHLAGQPLNTRQMMVELQNL